MAAYIAPGLPPHPVDWGSSPQSPRPAPAALLGIERAALGGELRWISERRLRWTAAPASRARGTARNASQRPSVDWDAIAMCESSGRWWLNVGPYDGGLQFDPDTWILFGGLQFAPHAWQASRAEQIIVAERVLAGQGPGAWPHCFDWGR